MCVYVCVCVCSHTCKNTHRASGQQSMHVCVCKRLFMQKGCTTTSAHTYIVSFSCACTHTQTHIRIAFSRSCRMRCGRGHGRQRATLSSPCLQVWVWGCPTTSCPVCGESVEIAIANATAKTALSSPVRVWGQRHLVGERRGERGEREGGGGRGRGRGREGEGGRGQI